MSFFPYTPRKYQSELVDLISRTVKTRTHLVLESGTGTGKTVCAISGVLESLDEGEKLLYLTRTNSQQRQVMLELRKIAEKNTVFGMGIQGRRGTCPLVRSDPSLHGGTPDELSRLCAEKKRRSLSGKEGGCHFYRQMLDTGSETIENYCRRELPTVEEFVDHCDLKGVCPYELMKELASDAVVVTAPYAYFFVPFIRYALMEWMNLDAGKLVVVVDEAHNLPDYARDTRSFTLTERSLELVDRELVDYGDPELINGVSAMDMISLIREEMGIALVDFLIEEDGLLPPFFLEEGLMGGFSVTSKKLESAAKALKVYGEAIREGKREDGRLPRSYVHALGSFLEFWMKMDEESFVKLVLGGDNPGFQGYCMDPSLACAPLLDCKATIHMSGTLEPLEEYRDSVGLPRNGILRVFPSPFPEENREILFLEDVTTRYEELSRGDEMFKRLEDYVVLLCNTLDRNTVVFFPSFSLMERFVNDGVTRRIRRRVHMEERGMSQADLMDTVMEFRNSREEGGVLFAVMGGRISEGLDFPDKDLEAALVVGIPYPKPSARQRSLLHYYELKFGRGWDYTVKAPATRKVLQAIGRLIRTENDIGVAVILDRRAEQFSTSLRIRLSDSIVRDVHEFFERRESRDMLDNPKRT
ncbi:MAG: ATP-dependent DNA helicase [Methanomassiliicoccales archaeon]|nr:ATP-dependent DNA helicase [Methanomassiliicoccales archaeon]NYT14471.1 ATP-dependent DNA helicase [Methanomassiliicoccales archaeon]